MVAIGKILNHIDKEPFPVDTFIGRKLNKASNKAYDKTIGRAVRLQEALVQDWKAFRKNPPKFVVKRTVATVVGVKDKIIDVADAVDRPVSYVDKVGKVYRSGVSPLIPLVMDTKISLYDQTILQIMGKSGVAVLKVSKQIATATKVIKVVTIPLGIIGIMTSTIDLTKSAVYRDKYGCLVNSQKLGMSVIDLVDEAIGIYSIICNIAGLQEVALISQIGAPIGFILIGGSISLKVTGIIQGLFFDRDLHKALCKFDGHVEQEWHGIGKIFLPQDPYTISDKDIDSAIVDVMKEKKVKKYDLAATRSLVRMLINSGFDEKQMPEKAEGELTEHLKPILTEVKKRFAVKSAIVSAFKKVDAVPEYHNQHTELRDDLLFFIQKRVGLTPGEQEDIIQRSFDSTKCHKANYRYLNTREEYRTVVAAFEKQKGAEKGISSFKRYMKAWAQKEEISFKDPKVKFFRKAYDASTFKVKRKQKIYGWRAGGGSIKQLVKMEKMLTAKKKKGQDLSHDEVHKMYKALQSMRISNRRQIAGKIGGIASKALSLTGLCLLYTGYTTIATPILFGVSAVMDLALLIYGDYFVNMGLKYPASYEGPKEASYLMQKAAKLQKFIDGNKYVPQEIRDLMHQIIAQVSAFKNQAGETKYDFWHEVTSSKNAQDLAVSYQETRGKIANAKKLMKKYKKTILEFPSKASPQRVFTNIREAM